MKKKVSRSHNNAHVIFKQNMRFKIEPWNKSIMVATLLLDPIDHSGENENFGHQSHVNLSHSKESLLADPRGALTYVIAVVFLWGLSIILLIASSVRRNRMDNHISLYLKDMEKVRNRTTRQKIMEFMSQISQSPRVRSNTSLGKSGQPIEQRNPRVGGGQIKSVVGKREGAGTLSSGAILKLSSEPPKRYRNHPLLRRESTTTNGSSCASSFGLSPIASPIASPLVSPDSSPLNVDFKVFQFSQITRLPSPAAPRRSLRNKCRNLRNEELLITPSATLCHGSNDHQSTCLRTTEVQIEVAADDDELIHPHCLATGGYHFTLPEICIEEDVEGLSSTNEVLVVEADHCSNDFQNNKNEADACVLINYDATNC